MPSIFMLFVFSCAVWSGSEEREGSHHWTDAKKQFTNGCHGDELSLDPAWPCTGRGVGTLPDMWPHHGEGEGHEGDRASQERLCRLSGSYGTYIISGFITLYNYSYRYMYCLWAPLISTECVYYLVTSSELIFVLCMTWKNQGYLPQAK